MEDHFNENYLESTKFPKSDFKGYIRSTKPIDYKTDGNYEVTADGTLTIHGVSQKINTVGKINITGGKAILSSEFKIK
ncbi:YceI family protein, partial [Salmonella enterica]|uniref:YceI family protein n=1 Tax=Salmonella enterica TaxID=28901 RepID=UPI003D2BCFEF